MLDASNIQRLLRSTTVISGQMIGAGNSIILTPGPTQTATGTEFTLEFSTGDVITGAQIGDSRSFVDHEFKWCKITSNVSNDPILVEFGYGMKYLTGGSDSGSSVVILEPTTDMASATVVNEAPFIGTGGLNGEYSGSVPPVNQSAVGGFPLANLRRARISCPSQCLQGFYVQGNLGYTAEQGVLVAPGEEKIFDAIDNVSGNGEFFLISADYAHESFFVCELEYN